MKALTYTLVIVVLLGLSGCIFMPWEREGRGHGEKGGGGRGGEGHEMHH